MNEYSLQVFAIIIGLAIFVTLLVIVFKLGSWANRLTVIERVLGPYIDKVDRINTSVALLLERTSTPHTMTIVESKKVEDGKSIQ